MKTAISASVICLVLAALADPVAAKADTSRRPAVGEMGLTFEVIEARQPQDLWPVGRSMRSQSATEQVAVAAPKTNLATAKGPEDEFVPETDRHHHRNRTSSLMWSSPSQRRLAGWPRGQPISGTTARQRGPFYGQHRGHVWLEPSFGYSAVVF